MSDTPNGRICWYELLSSDPDASQAFYSALVGWTPQQETVEGRPYTLWMNGPHPIGGLLALPAAAFLDTAGLSRAVQRRAPLYDKSQDGHYNLISALHKSIRGSDPDAALYWLAKMVYGGEEPRIIFRRLMILAAEDIGLADPQALVVTEAAASAFEMIGLPAGQFHLAEATIYCALAEKSNSTLGYFDALATVKSSSLTVASASK